MEKQIDDCSSSFMHSYEWIEDAYDSEKETDFTCVKDWDKDWKIVILLE